MSVLSARILEGREYLNFPPDRMASELGIDVSEYEAFESGETTPSKTQIAAIAWVCGTTPERLRGEDLRAGSDLEEATENGLMTHDDAYEIARFAEFLRVRATADPRESR